MVVQKTNLVLHLSSRSVSGCLFMVYCSPFRIMCRCTIVMFIDFYICFLINPSMRRGRFLRKPRLIELMRLVVVGIKIVAWKYCASSGLVVLAIILYTTIFYYCVSREASHIPFSFSLVHFYIFCTFFSPPFIFGLV